MFAVWGGDPVYPTINYEQDPDCVADYRNANMHEPTPDIIDQLREVGNHYPSFHATPINKVLTSDGHSNSRTYWH